MNPTRVCNLIKWPPPGAVPRSPHLSARYIYAQMADGRLALGFEDDAGRTIVGTELRSGEPVRAADFVRLRDCLVALRYDEIGDAAIGIAG